MIPPRRMLTTEEAVAEAYKADKVLNTLYQGAKDVVSPVVDTAMYFPGKLIGGLDAGVESLTGVSPLEYNQRVGEGLQGMLLGNDFEEGYSGTEQGFETEDSFVKNLGNDFLNYVTPIDFLSAGSVGNAVRYGFKRKGELGDDFVQQVTSSPDNVLPGYYEGSIAKAKALGNFAIDAFQSAMKSLDPKAIETFKETGYNPVMIKKTQQFVKEHERISNELKELQKIKYPKEDPRYKAHRETINELILKKSKAGKRVEAQIQHGLYIALRSGVKPDDLPPLYKEMLDKMSVKGTGIQDLSLETYYDTVKNEISKSSRKPKISLKTPKAVVSKMFDKVLSNWNVKNPEDFKLIVRQSDTQNNFRGDVSKFNTSFERLFNGERFENVDELHEAILKRQRKGTGKEKDFLMQGIGLKQGEKGQKTIRIGSRDYEVEGVATRKEKEGVYLSITGFPAYSAKEISKMLLEENMARREANKKIDIENKRRSEKGLSPKDKKKKKYTNPKEAWKFAKRKAEDTSLTTSMSQLEGGVNIEALVTPSGKVTYIISDDYNFLENVMPSLEEAFDTKILGVTPPMSFDLLASETTHPAVRVQKGGKRMTADQRNEYVTQLDLEGGDKIPTQIKAGLYGLGGMLAPLDPEEENQE